MPPRSSRADVLVGAALYLLALLVLGAAARSLGVTAGEPPHLAAASEALSLLASPGGLVERLSPAGLRVSSLGSLLGAWMSLVLHRGGDGPVRDALLSLRLGPALLSAAVAPVLYAVALPAFGRRLAVVAVLLAILVPRAVVQGAQLGGDGPWVALLWAGLLAHLRSRGRLDLGLLSGLLLSLALSLSWSALLALPLLLLHHALAEPEPSRRLAPRGLFSAPLSAVAFVAFMPVGLSLGLPGLWKPTGERLRDLLVSAASPRIDPGLWGGLPPMPDTVPRGYAGTMLLLSLPTLTAALALLGLLLFLRDRGAPRRRPELLVAALAILVFLGWPLLRPPALGKFPDPFLPMVPACALLAAHALSVLLRWLQARAAPPWSFAAVASCCLAWPLADTLLAPASLSASFPAACGGARVAAASRRVPLHDGSPLGAFAPVINRAGAARVFSPDLSSEVWEAMHRHGRLASAVRPVAVADAADLLVLTGDAAPPEGFRRLAAVRRDGQNILTLWGR